MDAGCGLSTRGHWDGPVICNEAGQAVRASVVRHGFHVIPPMGSMWSRQCTMFEAHSYPLWCTCANSSWFFQQWRGLRRCLPSMRFGEWPVVELTRCFTHAPGRCQPKWKHAYIASVHIFWCNRGNACIGMCLRWQIMRMQPDMDHKKSGEQPENYCNYGYYCNYWNVNHTNNYNNRQ